CSRVLRVSTPLSVSICLVPYILFFQAEDGIRYPLVTGVQTCALPISPAPRQRSAGTRRSCRGRARCASHSRARRTAAHRRRRARSEERRVGKESRALGAPDPTKKKTQ